MSIVTRYVLKEHAGPFFFGILTIAFVFLLNLIFRDLGRLLGKGLPAMIILEFFVLNMAWILALAVPMSVLVATLMTFGRMSSDNEIAALKAGGVHLYRLIAPIIIIALILTFGMERFNNSVLPEFNHRVRMLYSAISKKRPTLALEPHVFFDDIPDYSMLVQELDEETNDIRGVIINDYSDPKRSKTIIAESGVLSFSPSQERMVFTLYNGEIHDVALDDLEKYRRLQFEQQVISIAVPNMVLKRRESQHRGDREKTAEMMKADIARNRKAINHRREQIHAHAEQDLRSLFPEALWSDSIVQVEKSDKSATARFQPQRGRNATRSTQNILNQIQGELKVIQGHKRSIRKMLVELHKKYSIPVACLVFVLVGAPLGIMARQGGMAVGGTLSMIFFLVYWAFLIGGEQLGDRGIVSPQVAMWSPNIVVGLAGIYLVIHSVRETTFIPWEEWGAKLRRRGKRPKSAPQSG